jgi:tetratricopeptide (TPR) repeat protein
MISVTRVGDVQLATGDLAAAYASYESALKSARRIANNSPGDAGYRRDLAVSITKIGDVEFSRGNLQQAAKAFREALVIAEALSAADPANVVWLRDVITGHYSLAMAGDDPVPHFERALQIAEMMEADGRLAPADAYIPGALREALAKAKAVER